MECEKQGEQNDCADLGLKGKMGLEAREGNRDRKEPPGLGCCWGWNAGSAESRGSRSGARGAVLDLRRQVWAGGMYSGVLSGRDELYSCEAEGDSTEQEYGRSRPPGIRGEKEEQGKGATRKHPAGKRKTRRAWCPEAL